MIHSNEAILLVSKFRDESQKVDYLTLDETVGANADFRDYYIPPIAVSTLQAFSERVFDQGGKIQNRFGVTSEIAFGGYNLIEGITKEDGGQIIGGGLGLGSGMSSWASKLLKPALVTTWIESGRVGLVEGGYWFGSAGGAAVTVGASTALTWVGISFEMYRLGLAQPLMDAVNEAVRRNKMNYFSSGFAASLLGYSVDELK